MPKVFLTGASGLLGSTLAATLRRGGWRLCLHTRTCAPETTAEEIVQFPLEHLERIRPAIEACRPDWIVHTAACTDVEECERSPEDARKLHVEATRELSLSARHCGARMLLISTDSVYRGDVPGWHSESDAVAPVNVYASTKLEGENACRQESEDAIVARVNFFGLRAGRPSGLAGWILDRLRNGDSFPGFEDVIFNPLFNEDLAELIQAAMEQNIRGEIYNFGATDQCSKFAFARALVEEMGGDPHLVRPALLADAKLAARRPYHTAMATQRLCQTLGRPLPSVRDGIRRFVTRLSASKI